jgi:hypothetical protein
VLARSPTVAIGIRGALGGSGDIRTQVKNGYWVIPCDRLRFL